MLAVTPKMRFLVTAAMAGTEYRGSFTGNWAPDARTGPTFAGPLYTSYGPRTSAMNMAWKPALSSSRARSVQKLSLL